MVVFLVLLSIGSCVLTFACMIWPSLNDALLVFGIDHLGAWAFLAQLCSIMLVVAYSGSFGVPVNITNDHEPRTVVHVHTRQRRSRRQKRQDAEPPQPPAPYS